MKIDPIMWEDEFTSEEIAIFKKVKRAQMDRAVISRDWIVEQSVDFGDYEGKRDYILSRHGLFRICPSHNSDNTTETRAHESAGAISIHLDNPSEMILFFKIHHLSGEAIYESLRLFLKERHGQDTD